jgi:hypothetical protein
MIRLGNAALLVSLLLLSSSALAAEPAADSIEPGVNTSAEVVAAPAATGPAAPAGSKSVGAVPATASVTRNPAVSTPRSGARVVDRVELENTQITGNRELPRVMYVVPWKKPNLGDFGGRPAKSLLDELLQPLDRDVFRRQVRYYDALQPDAASGSQAATTGDTESTGAAPTGSRDEK